MFILVTAKSKNMLGVRELGEAVRLLNTVNEKFTGIIIIICVIHSQILFLVHNSEKNISQSFAEFCDSFCTINEPVRHFYVIISLFNDENLIGPKYIFNIFGGNFPERSANRKEFWQCIDGPY